MWSLVSNLKIRTRVVAIGLLPTLALAYFASVTLLERYEVASAARNVAEISATSPVISGLVHELQRERGASAGFLGSNGGGNFQQMLNEQRAATDAALNRYRTITLLERLGGDFGAHVDAARGRIGQLEALRARVRSFTVAPPEMAGYYSSLIADLLAVIEAMNGVADDGRIVRQIVAYSALLQGKERAGLERATGAAGFAAGAFTAENYRAFVRLEAAQDIFFSIFNRYGGDEQARLLARMAGSEASQAVSLARDVANAGAFGGSMAGVTGADWFARASERIDAMKAVEDEVAAELPRLAASIADAADRGFNTALVLALAVFAIVGVLATVIVRSITGPIGALTATMGELAQGRIDIKLAGAEGRSEIGAMARAVAVFRDNAIERQLSLIHI